jgi:hypothetical protein
MVPPEFGVEALSAITTRDDHVEAGKPARSSSPNSGTLVLPCCFHDVQKKSCSAILICNLTDNG